MGGKMVWMGKQVDEWMDTMDGWTMDGWVGEWVERRCGWVGRWMNECTVRWMSGCMGRRRVDRWVGAWERRDKRSLTLWELPLLQK